MSDPLDTTGPIGDFDDAFEAAAARVRARYPTQPGRSENLMQGAELAGQVGAGMAQGMYNTATAGPRMMQAIVEEGARPTPEEMVPVAMDTAMTVTGAGSPFAVRGALGSAGGRAKTVRVPLNQIEHGEAAMPGGTLDDPASPGLITKYAKMSTDFPPIEAIPPDKPGGKWMVYDGSRRFEAAKLRGDKDIRVIDPTAPKQEGSPLFTKKGEAIKGRAFSKRSRQVKEEIAAEGKGTGPLDLSGDLRITDVEQKPLPRYVPPRGVSERLRDALNNPDVIKGVNESIEAGKAMGAHRWYHNKPIYDAFIAELGEKKGAVAFKQYMDMNAASSPGSDVPTNIRNASYYYGLAQRGEKPPKNLPYPYGHKIHNLHRQNFKAVQSGGFDPLQNPKPPSYGANLAGNLEPGAMDTHAVRNIGMRTRDPRWLATSTQDILKKGEQPSARQRQLGEIKTNNKGETVVIYRPQQLLAEGKLTMDELVKMPTMWDGLPKANEYAALEGFYRTLGEAHGLPTADAQSAAWAGAGELTGLGTPPDKIFSEMFNERVEYTARMRGEKPSKTLSQMIRAQKPLLSTGAATAIGATEPVRELLGQGDMTGEPQDLNQVLGVEPQTPAQQSKEMIERGRTYDANRPIKNYNPSTPIAPGTPVQDPSTGQWGPGT